MTAHLFPQAAPNGIVRRMTRLIAALLLSMTLAARAAEDIVLADFEGKDYGAWKAEGEAIGAAPAAGTLANQQAVAGFLGKGLVNTYRKGDGIKGQLTSPPFK